MSSYITRAITEDGSARIFCTNSTEVVQKALDIHNTSKTCTAALGRALTACSLMGSMLKDKDNSLTLQFRGDGPAGPIVTVSDYKGNVRGYVTNPQVEVLPNALGKLDVKGVVGEKGYLYVTKDLGLSEPYNGVSPLVSGEIAEDVTEYFSASEQTSSACALGVRVTSEKTVKAAGGFIVQVMPGADEKTVTAVENNLKLIGSVSAMLAEGQTTEDIIAAVFYGVEYDLFDEFDTEYLCTCSREKYKRALVSLPDADIEELGRTNEPIETVCRFCNSKYVFDLSEIVEARNKNR